MLGLKLSKMAHGLESLSRLKLGPHARPGEAPETSEPSHLQLCRFIQRRRATFGLFWISPCVSRGFIGSPPRTRPGLS